VNYCSILYISAIYSPSVTVLLTLMLIKWYCEQGLYSLHLNQNL